MYKYLSMLLGALLLVAGGFYLFERHARSSAERELNNKIAKLEGMVKETESAYSSRGLLIEDLQSTNKDLQKVIDSRDEEVAALGEVVLQWKKKYFDIKNATGTVVGSDGTTVVEVPADCQTCLKDLRFRVDFDKTQDYLKVVGHTLTNPAEAQLEVSWERQLKLTFLLTKKDEVYRLYFDSNTPDLVPGTLTLKVDPSVFEKNWYEKIGVGLDVSVGPGVLTGVKVFYDITDNIALGPNVNFFYDGNDLRTLYGANVGWYPFR